MHSNSQLLFIRMSLSKPIIIIIHISIIIYNNKCWGDIKNLYIEEVHTTQRQKEKKYKRTNTDLQNTHIKLKLE
jgi:hypothetical protein